jgi:hypothetical protein
MVDFGAAIGNYVRSGYCLSLGNIATFGELMPLAGLGIGGAAGQAARFLHNAVCNQPPSGEIPPSFSGGQCDGATYEVFATARYGSDPVPGTSPVSGLAIGAISGIVSQNVAGNSTLIFALGKSTPSTPDGRYGIGSIPTSFGATNNFQSVSIDSVVRQGGQPDNCGSLPPSIPPYTPGDNIVNAPISYTDNNNTDIDIDASITFGNGRINFNGHLTIPFTINAQFSPEVNISGEFNLNTGDINYNAGNPALPGSECSPTEDDFTPDPNLPANPPSLPPESDLPNPDPDKPEYKRIIKGAIVTSSTPSPSSTVLFQPGGVDVYLPDLGLVYFQVSVGGRSGWTQPVRVQNLRQFIECPWAGGATAVRGVPRSGGSFTVTPVYVKVTAEQTYPD